MASLFRRLTLDCLILRAKNPLQVRHWRQVQTPKMERIEQLAALIAEHTDRDGGYATPIPGLYLSKLSTTTAPRHTLNRAVLCVVAQGAKSVLLDQRRYLYDLSQYFVISLDLPLVAQIVRASPAQPCLGLTMELDFQEIGALLAEMPAPPPARGAGTCSLYVSTMGDDLLDPLLRLVCLLGRPEHIPILAPLIRREIFYRLLLGEQAGRLRQMATDSRQLQHIAAGIAWLKRNALRPVRMDELAREVNMSLSTMHAWFKAATSMSPLQYQKQLRLQEARRLLLSETTDAATVSQQVGYQSPSQFSREYRRLFGNPPLRDIERIRASADGFHAPLLQVPSKRSAP